MSKAVLKDKIKIRFDRNEILFDNLKQDKNMYNAIIKVTPIKI